MSSNVNAVTALTPYSNLELLGMMSISMVAALTSIAFIYRLIKTVSTVRKYEDACNKMKLIEQKFEEMKALLATTQFEYERDLAEITKSHAQECFELHQLVFERNGEILELKNKLLKFNMNSPV